MIENGEKVREIKMGGERGKLKDEGRKREKEREREIEKEEKGDNNKSEELSNAINSLFITQ